VALESKDPSFDLNPLETKENTAIRGRHVLIFLALCPVVALLTAYLVRVYWGSVGGLMLPLGVFFGLALVALMAAVAPLRAGLFPALGFRPVKARFYVIGVVGTLALSVAASQLGIEPEGMKRALEIGRDPRSVILALAVMAVLAPIVEELVFRGLIYGWIENRWSPLPAAIVSTILFALAHFEPKHIILVLPLAIGFGWLRWYTGSIKPSLVAHIVNNGAAVLAAAFLPGS
jgi:membrane protease YdiL (CAAX protease family)